MNLEKNFSNLKLILVEPNGPLNVGSVARLCSNFEVDELQKILKNKSIKIQIQQKQFLRILF